MDVKQYFSFLSIAPAVIWVIIILIIAYSIWEVNRHKPHYKYYMRNVYAKLFFSLLFTLVYLLYYGGGDTLAYFEGTRCINNLLFESPSDYVEEVLHHHGDLASYFAHYNSHTGMPPGWIYREPEGWFVVRVVSFFSLFSFGSYFATTFIISFLVATASWRLFELALSYETSNMRVLAVGILLLPSVNFWCSGVTKDTIVLVSALHFVCSAFRMISAKHRTRVLDIVIMLITGFIVFKTRSFVLYTILGAFSFALMTRLVQRIGGRSIFVLILRTAIFFGALFFVSQTTIAPVSTADQPQNELLSEANLIHTDFKQNATYTGKRYDLGEIEFTPFGILRAMPLATITGLFRPFIWEALSPTLFLNGLESILFLYFIYVFFRRDFRRKLRYLREHEFLLFCLVLAVLLAFMAGLTSILFGVLVRLRSIALPFLFVALSADYAGKIAEADERKRAQAAEEEE